MALPFDLFCREEDKARPFCAYNVTGLKNFGAMFLTEKTGR